MRKSFIALSCVAVVASLGIVAHEHPFTEAPAGFDSPTLAVNPGSQSVSNGIQEPPGDTFALDQAKFEQNHDPSTGLGPVFNATSCATCHANGVTGAASQMSEIRVGHKDANGNFVNPTILINDGASMITGRSIVDDRSICEQAQEHVPDTENIRTFRAVLNTLGDGFVEAVEDSELTEVATHQPERSNGEIHGEAIQVPVLEAPTHTQIGRFGWKDQQPTVLSFVADAYVNEMGVTSRLRPKDVTSVCKVTTDPEDTPDSLGLADIDHFAQFIRGTKAPPRDTQLAATPDAQAGAGLFRSTGCNICHVETFHTAAPGTVLNGGTYTVSAALGDKIIHPFSDFLLHDVGTGDGIFQAGPPDTVDKLRTPALWGLHIKSRFMHDLQSLTVSDAIQRHKGEAKGVIKRFNGLSSDEQQQLITFLRSL
ncbi:MAG: hypothetical protein JO061_08385 [Acidobacteriaceae bacterium]|nr:hypothetical protein [Acidobacteriaceae bacterium]